MRIALLFAATALALTAADNSPIVGTGAESALVGTWSLRVDRSDMRPHQILSEKAVITQNDPYTWHYVYDFEYKDGRKTHSETDRTFDGKERPATNERIETGAHPDAFNWISRLTKDGKLASEIHSQISADRKTQTVERTTVTATETFTERMVFERQ